MAARIEGKPSEKGAGPDNADRKSLVKLCEVITESKSNRHIIYKFMRFGFDELSLEELACTLVNPTFTIDFKRNVKEEWTANYHVRAVDRLRENDFPMDWFIKQCYASGYEN